MREIEGNGHREREKGDRQERRERRRRDTVGRKKKHQ
jgi:hypothetical protein